MLRRNFCRSDGRLVKFLLSFTLELLIVDKSPLTFIFLSISQLLKRRVRSPLPPQSNFLVFGKTLPFLIIRVLLMSYNYHVSNKLNVRKRKGYESKFWKGACIVVKTEGRDGKGSFYNTQIFGDYFLVRHYYRWNHRRPSTLSQFVGISITDICWIYCFLTYSKLEPAV